jgi:origin recognition complex subunit 2
MKSDAGADLFFDKKKRRVIMNKKPSKPKRLSTAKDDSTVDATTIIEFPSLQSYSDMARAYSILQQQQQQQQQQDVDFDDDDDAGNDDNDDSSAFEKWRFLASTNHSLLFYGVGSKQQLLNQFADQELDKDGDVIKIDGFDTDVTIDGILQLLIDHWLDGKEPFAVNISIINNNNSNRNGLANQCRNWETLFYHRRGDAYIVQKAVAVAKAVAKVVTKTLRPVYLVLHNIDGVALRNFTAQEALAALVSQSNVNCGWNAVRLIASIDHVNAPALLWDSLSQHRFHWVWKEVHTDQPYVEEVLKSQVTLQKTRSSGKRGKQQQQLQQHQNLDDSDDPASQKDSIFSVLKSLASRHTQALQQLAWLHLESKQEWVTYVDLLHQCRLKCVVTQDTQLRNYLGELMDHNIVIRKNEKASSTSYRIPYPENVLDLILDYQPDN